MTVYVYTEVSISDNSSLYIDGNSKIAIDNGSFNNPKPNAFSLPHISTCPGATNTCMSSCYIYGLQNNAPDVYQKYMHNERVLHKILLTQKSLNRSAEIFGNWISENCKGGFRWYVSGDIINDRHANWIILVTKKSPNINHWIYTRTLNLAHLLVGHDNLSVNISADRDNYMEARKVAIDCGFRLCYMTKEGEIPDDMVFGDVILPDYNLRGRELDCPTDHEWWKALSISHKRMVCPPDFFGQSERFRCGPCKKCLFPKKVKI